MDPADDFASFAAKKNADVNNRPVELGTMFAKNSFYISWKVNLRV